MNHLKEQIKGIIFSVLSFFSNRLNGVSVLMYHSISDNPTLFCVSSSSFKKHIEYIKEKKIKVIFLSEAIRLIKQGENLSNTVCLTFDDGYKDNYKDLFPIIKEYNIPVTIFVATGFIDSVFKSSDGGSFSMLSSQEIVEMNNSGLVEFMPHTDTHINLENSSMESSVNDIVRSKEIITGILNTKADILAYPKGRFNSNIKLKLPELGFIAAVGVKRGILKAGVDLYDIPRNYVNKDTSFSYFKSKLTDAIGYRI